MNRKGRHEEVDTKPHNRHHKKEMEYTDTHSKFNRSESNEDMETESSDSRQSSHRQVQMQHQLQRSMEASKQMLYGTFGNVISILEEFEQREMKDKEIQHHMPRSNIYIPEQKHKSFDDVRCNVETQILLFETQAKACPPEAKAEILDELRRRTMQWAAVREENEIKEIHHTDLYISKLYEILAKGRTDHKKPERQVVTETTMRDGFQAIMYGNHDREVLDQAFKSDKNKKAKAPETRSSETLYKGAIRINRARGAMDLDSYLQQDVQNFEQLHDLK